MRPIFLLDVDDVLADFSTAYMRVINEVAGLNLGPADHTEWNLINKAPKEHHEEILRRAREEGFCSSLGVVPGAQEAVHSLRLIGEVFAVTSPWKKHKTWCHERTEWLETHLGFYAKNVLHASAKYLVRGSVMIDDRPENLIEWADWNHIASLPLLWDRPHNRNEKGLLRVGGWPQAVQLLESIWWT
jgi:5'(3')-deoxyribonucleotidase